MWWVSAGLSNILDYQAVYWRKFLQLSVCYCSYAWAAQLIRVVFHLDKPFSCWFFKISEPALTECAVVSYFHFIKKKPFLITIGLTTVSPAVNLLSDTFPSCANLCSFNVCHLKKSFTPSLDAINNYNWSFHFLDSWWSNVVWSHNLSSTSAAFQSPNYLKFLWNPSKLHVSSCHQHLLYSC